MYSRDEDTSGGSGSMGHPGPQALQNSLESRRSSISLQASIDFTFNGQCETDHTQFIHHTCRPGKSDTATEISASSFAVRFI
jgi:hypothetical protein